jgi:hypothetical protein
MIYDRIDGIRRRDYQKCGLIILLLMNSVVGIN